jgi:hypothetical protein
MCVREAWAMAGGEFVVDDDASVRPLIPLRGYVLIREEFKPTRDRIAPQRTYGHAPSETDLCVESSPIKFPNPIEYPSNTQTRQESVTGVGLGLGPYKHEK